VARLGKPFADVAWMPPVEAFERDHRLTVRVELPGMKKEEIGITFTDAVLTIEGERGTAPRARPGPGFSPRAAE